MTPLLSVGKQDQPGSPAVRSGLIHDPTVASHLNGT